MWEERDKLDILKEETKDLQRLLKESYIRLEIEYKKKEDKHGGSMFVIYLDMLFNYLKKKNIFC